LQLCGARGGGQAASRALYWVANKSVSLMLVLESERERNAAILLARRFARDQDVSLQITTSTTIFGELNIPLNVLILVTSLLM
jgi:hypothetical protein